MDCIIHAPANTPNVQIPKLSASAEKLFQVVDEKAKSVTVDGVLGTTANGL